MGRRFAKRTLVAGGSRPMLHHAPDPVPADVAPAKARQASEMPHKGRLFLDVVSCGESILTDTMTLETVALPADSQWELVFDDESGLAVLLRHRQQGGEADVEDLSVYMKQELFEDSVSGEMFIRRSGGCWLS